MITPKDVEIVRGTYRIHRLLCSPDEPAESHSIARLDNQRKVLDVAAAEDQRRKPF